ncbi:hypothetical protein EDB87DRAFT_574496 [Lactarius vividus]|nr:hypothetical protein EDB87DRAFT_574496 [Lactarius vividus]
MQVQETAPTEVVADLKSNKDPTSAPPLESCQPSLLPGSLPLPMPRQPGFLPGEFPPSTPRQPDLVPENIPPRTPCPPHPFLSRIPPETDSTVTKHTPSPESVASASARRNGGPDGASAEPMPGQHGGAGGWGPAITMGGDANPEGPTNPLRLGYIREVSTAPTTSASGPGTPADDAQSSSLDQDDGFDVPGAKLTKNQMRRLMKARMRQQSKDEKNSPRPPSREISNSVDNSVVQEPKPVATVPLDT